jgi:sialate O-acetylesterase
MLKTALLSAFFFQMLTTFADVKLPGIISDNMILQRNQPNKIWGWAESGEKITVAFNGKNYPATASADGKWMISLPALLAGGPFRLTVSGKNTINVENVLVGEVWICSGQSNMEWKMKWLGETYKTEMGTAKNDNIRLIDLTNEYDFKPRENAKIQQGWTGVSPQSLPEFSAVAYFFAKTLYEKYKIPIGLISSEWGGTVAEAWTSYEGLKDFPHYRKKFDELKVEFDPAIWESKVAAQQVAWDKALIEKDKANQPWLKEAFEPQDWKMMNLPGSWESQGLPDLDGIVVFRKEILLTQADLGKDLALFVAAVDDIDTTYFNGVKVGFTEGYTKQRQYTIPAKLLKSGKNIIAVKVLDTGGGGGIHGEPKNLRLETPDRVLSLAGDWQYRISVSNKDMPPNPREMNRFPNQPAILYNAMIAPLTHYGIRGAIWYQGESNAAKAYEYRNLFPAMISDWRKQWNQGDFPFLFVQLANFMATTPEPAGSDWAELREAQLMTLKLPKTGMACIIDIGEAKDIHPKNKLDVGKRLAWQAMQVAYGEKLTASGPIYKSMKTEGDKIRLTFTQTGSGLMSKSGELKQFAIAGADQKFVWANAKIENNTVVVWNESVKNPVAVRYAWASNPEGCNLYNKENLPASPFRTDSWQKL